MTKKLVVIRHAKSDWNTGLQDFDRPLNERGRGDAPTMGNYLKSLNLTPDAVLSSSAERAITTARLISHSIGFPIDEIQSINELYHAAPKTYLQVINHVPNSVDTVFVVGHNPGISDFVSYLVGENYELKTCCVAILDVKVTNWDELFQETCVIQQYISPKEL